MIFITIHCGGLFAGSNPPLTATFKEESRLPSGLFFAYSALRGMRSPDRGSTKRPAVLHGRRPPEGRAQRVNPPLTATFKEESRLTSGLFFAYFALRGMRRPDRGSTKRPAVLHGRQATRRASAASESPSHRHIQRRA